MRRLVASCSVVLIAMAVLGACGGATARADGPSDTEPVEHLDPTATARPTATSRSSTKTRRTQKFKITFVNDSGDETDLRAGREGQERLQRRATRSSSRRRAVRSGAAPTPAARRRARSSRWRRDESRSSASTRPARRYVSVLGRYGDTRSKRSPAVTRVRDVLGGDHRRAGTGRPRRSHRHDQGLG